MPFDSLGEKLWLALSFVGTGEMMLTMFGRTPARFACIPLATERVAVLPTRVPDANAGYRHEKSSLRAFPYAELPERIDSEGVAIVRSADRRSYRLWATGWPVRAKKGWPFFARVELHDEGDAIRMEGRVAPFALSAVLGLPAFAAAQRVGVVPQHGAMPPAALVIFTLVVIGWNVGSYFAARRAFARAVALLAGDIQRAAAPRVGPL